MLAKLEFLINVFEKGVVFSGAIGKKISRKILGTRYSQCCNARVVRTKKGIAMEVCEACGKVHFESTVLEKR